MSDTLHTEVAKLLESGMVALRAIAQGGTTAGEASLAFERLSAAISLMSTWSRFTQPVPRLPLGSSTEMLAAARAHLCPPRRKA